ncbi:MAG TPA: hypothetical protein VMK16_19480, partial [Acidimicrobiales bacterium]|nr:hypothetical protein [Acidimicrobiales bacterium]
MAQLSPLCVLRGMDMAHCHIHVGIPRMYAGAVRCVRHVRYASLFLVAFVFMGRTYESKRPKTWRR